MTDDKLADEIELFVEGALGEYSDLGFNLRKEQWQQIIAALRRSGTEDWDAASLRVKVSQQLETIRELRQKLEHQPSSDKVLVPREPTEMIIRVLLECTHDGHSAGYTYKAMLAAAEAEEGKS